MDEKLNIFYNIINSHKSIRSYKPDPIPEPALERILSAAIRASSSGNMQSYSIIVTTDLEIRKQLYKPHFEQNMVLEAPAIITFCADFNRMREWLRLSNAKLNFDNFMSFMIGSIDAILASQNAALAAEAEGLGICYMGTTLASCDQIAKILNCPSHVVPVVGFSIGYPNESLQKRDRLPLHSIVHREKYHQPSSAEIKEFYSARETNGWKRYMSDPELKKRVEDMRLENLAQIYTEAKYTRESHIQYSQIVLNLLKEVGFFEHENRG